MGWDAKVGVMRDLTESPRLYDPTLVVVKALEAAVSVSTMLLTAEASIVPKQADHV